MGRNRVSNNVDHIPIDAQAKRPSKERPPEPGLLPAFKPMKIGNLLTYGRGNLPTDVPSDPYTVFSLFFTDYILQVLADHTNEYAELNLPPPEKKHARPWFPTSPQELRVYIGIYVYIGLHIEPDVADYWNISPDKPIHAAVTRAIALVR